MEFDGQASEKRGRLRRNRRKQGGKDTVLYPQLRVQGASEFAICCVDDTDDLTGCTSTGAIAESIARHISELGGHVCLGITRHQLLLAQGVPYTSHNSSMAFVAELPCGCMDELSDIAVAEIASKKADSSDPGLCIAVIPSVVNAEVSRQIALLERFGEKAKRQICTKEEAYGLADAIDWVHLSAHGGTGEGVIGSLAGVGLRLGGSDGRFRGQWDLWELLAKPEECVEIAAGELKEMLCALVGGGVRIVNFNGLPVADDSLLRLTHKAKPILNSGTLTLVVQASSNADQSLLEIRESAEDADMVFLKLAKGGRTGESCEHFHLDNDMEECVDSKDYFCGSCLYRRWTFEGFQCVKVLDEQPASA